MVTHPHASIDAEQVVDVAIIGAGIAGSALSYHLQKMGVQSIAVFDADLEGEFSSTELNAGGVRGTWTTAVNIELSRTSIEFFEKHADEFGYKAVGYLWLHRPETFDAALKTRELHLKSGWEVDAFSVNDIQNHAPFIDKTSDLAGALFGRRDGLINPNALKNWFRKEANAAQFFDQHVLVSAEAKNLEWHLQFQLSGKLKSDDRRQAFENNEWPNQGIQKVRAKTIVNCAGPWAPNVAKIIGAFCPSFPLRRQISLFDCRSVDLTKYGMIIDPTGVYFHPEATFGLSGFASPNESPGYRMNYDGVSFFEETIWPALYERSSHFESLKHVSGWGGLYEVSPDHHAILGRMKLDETIIAPAYECHSFSGHGIMQAYAAGKAVAELIVDGKMQSTEIARLGVQRFLNAKSFASESWVI